MTQEIYDKWFSDKGDITHRLKYYLNEDSIVFDVGGYTGIWTQQIWERYGCNIYVFEPIKEIFNILKEKFNNNPKIKIFNFGLSNVTKEVEMSVLEDSSSIYRQSDNKEISKVVDIQEFMLDNDIKLVDLMKINIEGEEYNLLEGIIEKDFLNLFTNIQVQYHIFMPNSIDRRNDIRKKMSETHFETYCYDFVWENWRKKGDSKNNISIVTGTLNRLQMLKEIISNTVMRSDKLELVLLDGGSTDGTIEYVKSLNCERINLIEIGGRSSYPSFMNIGIRAAKYDWIAQWNDDVLLINEWEDVFNLIDGADAYIFEWTRGSIDDFKHSNIKTINPSNFGSYWITFHDCMNFGLYKKSVFKEIGLYDNKFKYYECDHDMTTRCRFFGYDVVNVNEIKVFEIQAEKRSLNYDDDRILYIKNRELYTQKKLPTTVEML